MKLNSKHNMQNDANISQEQRFSFSCMPKYHIIGGINLLYTSDYFWFPSRVFKQREYKN